MAKPHHGRQATWVLFPPSMTRSRPPRQPSKPSARPLEDRTKAVECIKKICVSQAEELGRLELEETQIGRLDHKIAKLRDAIPRVPGVEYLRTDNDCGDNGLTLTDYVPFGVIGAITPVTHSLPTLAGNAINMLAAGNTVVFNAHPSGARSPPWA